MTGTGSSVLSFTMARTFLSIYMLILFEHNSRTSANQEYTFLSFGYIGCFEDQQVLPIRLNDSKNNTGSQCRSRCRDRGYLFAGTKAGNQCFCGNTIYSSIYADGECIEHCPGNKCEKCGGSNCLSMFDTRVNDNCRSAKCKTDEVCKEVKNGLLCISNTTLQSLVCSYNGTTKSVRTTAAPTPISAGTTLPTNHMNTVPTIKPFISNDLTVINTDDRQYFIYTRNLSYLRAKENCIRWKAAIVSYTNPVQYIYLQRNVTVNGTYWVGGEVTQADDKCLVLDTRGSTSLYSMPCTQRHYSICSRLANISYILNQPEFVELIQNMTVNSRKTTKMKRKLNCSHDTRSSAKAIGAVIGAGVISVICSLLFLSDLQNTRNGKLDHKKAH